MDLLDNVRTRLRRELEARGDLAGRWPHEGSRALVRKLGAAVGLGDVPADRAQHGAPLARFDALGGMVEDRWRARGHDVDAFADIAQAALRELPPFGHVRADEVLRWVGRQAALPSQNVGTTFGDFQIQVFSRERFFIEVLFWTNGTTSVHQHGFAGALQVLEGSSVHAEWGFDLEEQVDRHLLVGEVRQKSIELLRAGDTRPIVVGNSFIHSLFHLDKPSVTVVVRTRGQPGLGPQYSYFRSNQGRGVAMDPHYKRPELARKLTCLALLLETQHGALDDFVREAIATEDAYGACVLLRALSSRGKDPDRVARSLSITRTKLGRVAGVIEPVLAEILRQEGIVSMRSKVSDPEHRFFLALLLNARTRSQIHALVQGRFPDRSPGAAVLAWLRALLAADPDFAGERLDAPAQAMMELLVGGLSIQQIVAGLAAHPVLSSVRDEPSRIAARCREIAALPRLRPLTLE